jgi:hypothetical protein
MSKMHITLALVLLPERVARFEREFAWVER